MSFSLQDGTYGLRVTHTQFIKSPLSPFNGNDHSTVCNDIHSYSEGLTRLDLSKAGIHPHVPFKKNFDPTACCRFATI